MQRARAEGWRSRAVFKLVQLQRSDNLLRPGHTVVDLGAAPGAWSQYAADLVGASGQVIALDLLAMDDLPGVGFIQGDFREDEPLRRLQSALAGSRVDIVLSDMAPNMSGQASVDIPRMMYLCELAYDFARQHSKPGASLVCKTFQGEGFDELLRALRSSYATVRVRKPEASRPRSRECYLVATGFTERAQRG